MANMLDALIEGLSTIGFIAVLFIISYIIGEVFERIKKDRLRAATHGKRKQKLSQLNYRKIIRICQGGMRNNARN